MDTFPQHAAPPGQATEAVHYELRFEPLSTDAGTLVFPCDQGGHVFFDELSEPAKRDYLYARVVVGHEFALPVVVAANAVPLQ